MFANRMLLLGAAMGLLLGCGHDDRANAAPNAATTPTPTAAPVRAATSKPAAKRAPTSGTVAKTPPKTPSKTATKTGTKPAAKPASAGAVTVLKVPAAQLPQPGQCRIWKKDAGASQQPQPRSCNGITPTAPAGSMVLYRTAKEPRIVRVGYIDQQRAGMVVQVRVFDASTLKFLRDEKI